MIYLLEGKETYKLKEKQKQLIKKSGADAENILFVDASAKSSFNFETLIGLCGTISLFGDRRVIILNNPYFLKSGSRTTAKQAKEKVPESIFQTYINSPNPDTDLLIICDGYQADKRSKEYKILADHQNKGVIIETFSNPSPWELDEIIDKELRKHKLILSKEAKNELKQRINGSATEFYQSLDKMILYGSEQLELKDIEHLVSYNSEVNIWKLGDAFISGNANSTLQCINEMTIYASMDIYSVIPTLTFRIKQLYQVIKCNENGLSPEMIKKITGRLYPDKDIAAAHGHSSGYFLGLLADLADLDQKMKSGQIDGKSGFEYFILEHLNYECYR